MAVGVESMIEQSPHPWLERMLLHFLPARDRETISGDLLEEYREEKAPRLGALRANFWYLRQVLSLMPFWDLVGPRLNQLLMVATAFIVAAGLWLAIMENVLRHAGYRERTLIAATIVIQGVATLLLPLLGGRKIFRAFVAIGAIALAILGASAIRGILAARHFEGFVLLIGFALVVQGLLTLVVVLRPRRLRML
jgi:hypothetical protein